MNFSGSESFFTDMNRRKVNYEIMQSPSLFSLDDVLVEKTAFRVAIIIL